MTTGGKLLTPTLDAPGVAPDGALFGLWNEELSEALRVFGLPRYRIRQLETALYKQKVAGLEEVTTWPKELRERVAAAGSGWGCRRLSRPSARRMGRSAT